MSKIILASGSPRRQEMLRRYCADLEIKVPDIDESEKPKEKPTVYCKRLALTKARAVSVQLGAEVKGSVIIAADTIVVLNNMVYGKPVDPKDACRILKRLSGKTHTVQTAVAMIAGSKELVFVEKTQVTFRTLSAAEIKAYVTSGESMDKAGAYAAQGLGMGLIQNIKGSYTNVVGLPLAQTLTFLEKKFKIKFY
jgi:septum formation protein